MSIQTDSRQEASSTVEDYLKAILNLEGRDPESLVSMGQIGVALEVAPGTVTSMIKTLADGGLVVYEPYSGVRLAATGRKLATRVLRRHRLIELFLVEVMGMDWSSVHDEADRLEHAVSDELVDRMDKMLGRPSVDPHGDPIPTIHGVVEESDYESLASCRLGVRQRVARVTDQNPDFLKLVDRYGLVPGNSLSVPRRDEVGETIEILLEGSDRTISLGLRVAAKILVEPPA